MADAIDCEDVVVVEEEGVVTGLLAEEDEVVTALLAEDDEVVTGLLAEEDEVVTELLAEEDEVVTGLLAEKDEVGTGLLAEAELEVMTDDTEDALKVDSEEDATVAELEAWEADEVLKANKILEADETLAADGEDRIPDEEEIVLEVDGTELATLLATLLKERVSTDATCATDFEAVLDAIARTVLFVGATDETTEEAREVMLEIELERELLGQLCTLCVTVWRAPVTVEVARLVIVVVL
jgi:hypothetical protein